MEKNEVKVKIEYLKALKMALSNVTLESDSYFDRDFKSNNIEKILIKLKK